MLRKTKGGQTGNFSFLQKLFNPKDSQAGVKNDLEGAALNQPVGSDYEPANYSGPQEFYSPTGQVTTNPAVDTRNWWQRNILGNPDTAGRLNSGAALANIQGRMGNLTALESVKQKAAFENSQFPTKLGQRGQELEQTALSDVNRARQLGQLAIEQGPQPNLDPSQIDFRFSGDPTNRELYPFRPDTTAGMIANAKLGEEASQQQVREAAIKEGQRPRFSTVGDVIFRQPDAIGGNLQPEYMVQPGVKQAGKPMFSPDGKYMGSSPESMSPSRLINMKPAGNVYGQSGGSNIVPPAISQFYNDIGNLRGPASTQRQEYVTASSPDGGPPQKVETQGQPPTTSIEPPYDYGRPMAAPTHRLRPGGNPDRLAEQVAGQTSPIAELSEEEKLNIYLNKILRGLRY